METCRETLFNEPDRGKPAQQVEDIIFHPDVFALAAETMARRGYVGDPGQVELLYAVFTSRLMARPMCAFLKAPSSSGKSWLLNRTLELFPPTAYELKSGITPKAIAYGRTDLRHRILAIQEASGLNGAEGNLLVRTLISEGQVRWEVAGRQRDGFATREVVRPGPIAFVMTTTHDFLHGEDETRALSIQVDDTAAQTRRVLDSIARRYGGAAPAEPVDPAPWQDYQSWLEAGPREAAVPFAGMIARHYWAEATRSKRDFEQVLTAIGVSALLHQARRQQDSEGRVIATLEDYAKVRRFLLRVLGEAAGTVVPQGVREVVHGIIGLAAGPGRSGVDGAHWPDVRTLTRSMAGGFDRTTIGRRVAKAKAMGYVIDRRRGPGLPSQLVVVQQPPLDIDVLPTVEKLREMDPTAEWAKVGAEAAPATTTAPAATGANLRAAADSGAAPAAAAAPVSQPVPPIIAFAPRPYQPDGGYRGRRLINLYRQAVEEMGAAVNCRER